LTAGRLDLPVDASRADGAPGALLDDLDDAEKRIDATLADPRCSRPWAVAVLHQGDEVNLTRWGPAKGLPKLVTPSVSLIKAQGQPED